jgi:8-oxo-dGTP pyrophosphatase MutT (NUDIX family)
MAKRYVTSGEAARHLGISISTLHRWLDDGLVRPAHRVGRRGDTRWDLDDLDRQLRGEGQGQTQAPTQAPTRQEAPPVDDPTRPQKPSVILAVVRSRDGVLLGRRNDGSPPWTFIAGENEPGESPQDTAIREVKEETGLSIKVGEEIAQRVHPRSGRHQVYVAAKPAGRDRRVFVGDPEELAEVRWVPLAEAVELMREWGGMHDPVRDHLARTLPSSGRGTARAAQEGQEAEART